MKRPRSVGERLFAAYLRQRGLTWAFEPEIEGRNIDFVVNIGGDRIACEVYEPEFRLPSTAGSFDSYGPIRGGFQRRKQKQKKAVAKAGMPFILVLGSDNSDVPFSPTMTAGAMFGAVGVTFAIDHDRAVPDTERTSFLGGGRLQPGLNRGLSAVALVRKFNPTLSRVERAYRARLARVPSAGHAEVLRVIKRTVDHMADTGDFDTYAAVARLCVLHNPFAERPLSLSLFGGPHDQQWGGTEGEHGLTYGLVAEGRRCFELPG